MSFIIIFSLHLNTSKVVESMAGSNSIAISYGFETLEENDPYISHAEKTMTIVDLAYPGHFMVDHFPFREFPFVHVFHASGLNKD